MNKIYKGDVGTEIILNMQEDVSTSTVRKIKYKKPGGATGEWIAVLDGTNNIKYVTVANDLDIAGDWDLTPYLELPAWQGHGHTVKLKIYDIFK